MQATDNFEYPATTSKEDSTLTLSADLSRAESLMSNDLCSKTPKTLLQEKRERNTESARKSRAKKMAELKHFRELSTKLQQEKAMLTSQIKLYEAEKMYWGAKELDYQTQIQRMEELLKAAYFNPCNPYRMNTITHEHSSSNELLLPTNALSLNEKPPNDKQLLDDL
jgi:hypothetical protein